MSIARLFAFLRYRYYNEMMFNVTGSDPPVASNNTNECEDLPPELEAGMNCTLVIIQHNDLIKCVCVSLKTSGRMA